MDAVNAFNQELFSLMDMKPPISRAKMILITKAAIKAIKLYKHVVQIVEKFIKKCKPEYKVPGLYVIDSIVRQSRHQFGIDKDVFGPRFTKNLTATFQCLYLCPTEDKSKIVRVLNLWQKNGVFKIEIIQPLLDMAAGAAPAELLADSSANEEGSSPPPPNLPLDLQEEAPSSIPAVPVPQLPNPDAFAAVAQLFQSSQGQQLQQILQTFQQPPKPQSPAIDENVYTQVQAIASQMNPPSHQTDRKTAFDKLLDRFDYDDEPEAADETKKEALSPSASPPQPPFQFPGETMQPPAQFSQIPGQMQSMDPFQAMQPRMMGMPQEPLLGQTQMPPVPPTGQMLGFGMIPAQAYPTMVPPVVSQASPQPFLPVGFSAQQNDVQMVKESQPDVPMEVEEPNIQESKRHMTDRQKSASRSPKRRRSRSGSRSRRSRHRRSRSRSRDRRRHSPKSRSQEKRDREKERERRMKGLPPIKTDAVSVCSTTLWVGQLDKRTTQQDVGSLLEEFGPIESINMIPPRGCAYIVMVQRLDAYRALQKLSRGSFKVNQKAIKIAWALNKGIKAEYKQYWDVEIGVTYIPWSKVKPEDLEALCEGGMLDNDTLCAEWKAFITKKAERKETPQNGASDSAQAENISNLQPPVPLLSLQIRQPMAPGPQPVPSVPPLSAVPAVPTLQPSPALPTIQGLPPLQGLPPPQGVPPPQGLPIPPSLPPLQGMPLPQGMPVPGFPGPINIPPPGFAPGVPPPPFMRPGFNPMQMPPGFLPPPGMPPPMTPPLSLPPPVSGLGIPTSTAGPSSNDSDVSQGNMLSLGAGRENMESDDNGNGFGPAPQGGPTNAPGPMNPHHGSSQGGPPQGPQTAATPGSSQGPPGAPPGPPNSSQGPPQGLQGPPQSTSCSSQGSSQGPPIQSQSPMSGPPQGPSSGTPPGPVIGLQSPSTGLLGARPGLIPLQRPPGVPTPHMQRFPGMPHRPMPPHLAHRGPPPGPGGFGMPPPHGMRGPFPPMGHFGRQGGHGGPEEGRPFRNDRRGFNPERLGFNPERGDRHGFNPDRNERIRFNPESEEEFNPEMEEGPVFNPEMDEEEAFNPEMEEEQGFKPERPGFNPDRQGFRPDRPGFPERPGFNPERPGFHPDRNDRQGFLPERERFGRRSFGNRNEGEREHFGSRFDNRDHDRPGRGRRSWGRGSPDRDRPRESEERNRWPVGREREPRRVLLDFPDSRKPIMNENHEPAKGKPEQPEKEKAEPKEQKPVEEKASKVSPPSEPAKKESGST
ncbi:SR-related and CTD-associated factor 4 isoform X2 [Eleutherodactylus coqui]|uniref:SR-related and CTD-associated factor 4 isoform X2 n=1 Tax=Eleutherodactylus coqui TaxID=57060 RepID=UPI003461C143